MRKWHLFSLGIVAGMLVAVGFGFAWSGGQARPERSVTFAGQPIRPDDGKLGIIEFGAHPDDCEIRAGGVAVEGPVRSPLSGEKAGNPEFFILVAAPESPPT